MKKRVVILTESSKYGQKCVAGINCRTGELIRLVSTDENTHGALSCEDLKFENGREAKQLDVIDVEVIGNENNLIQPENFVIDRKYYFNYIKTVTIKDAIILYKGQKEKWILGNNSFYLDEECVAGIDRSLSLSIVHNLKFERCINNQGQEKIKLAFTYNGYNYSKMPVTDPEFYGVENGKEIERAVIIVSIGKPFNEHYYKFVAAIYPL